MALSDRLAEITRRLEYVEAQMGEGRGDIAALGREYAELKPVVDEIAAYRRIHDDIADAEAMLADPEMRALAEEELAGLRAELPRVEERLRLALLPKDAADARPAILEIRPGTGGEEAALFAADLLRMYQRYAEAQGLAVRDRRAGRDRAGRHQGGGRPGLGARGSSRGSSTKSGVHRVQRVPSTESGGRIHTSAATVAVLPEAEEVDIAIDPAEIRIDTMRASGAGGQHVNTTDIGGADHPHPHRHRRDLESEKSPAPEPRDRHAGAARAALRHRAHARRRPSAPPTARRRWARATAPSGSAPTTFPRAG